MAGETRLLERTRVLITGGSRQTSGCLATAFFGIERGVMLIRGGAR